MLLLSGCAGLGELRSEPPRRALFSAQPYDAVAECVARRIDESGQLPPTLRIDRERGVANVYLTADTSAIYDVTLRRKDGGTQIEGRNIRTISGGSPQLDRVWPAVEACAGN